MEIFNMVTLGLSGLLLFILAGVMRISNPVKVYLKNSGIELNDDVNTLSEVRGMSAVMLLGGLTVLSGILVPQLIFTSFIVAIILFVGYALGRLISFGVDGKPNKLIITGLLTEIIFGSLNIFCLAMILL